MRGIRGTQMSGLPLHHWRDPQTGKVLCGARRKWGVLTADKLEHVECKRCKKKLEDPTA